MQNITWDLIGVMAIGISLFLVVGLQYHFGKVYTRGGRGTKWHDKPFVSREEAPCQFWIIIGTQFAIGAACGLISGVEIVRRVLN